ncbi:AAA family ATPase [Heliobacterium chlorum]|nr:AAA family ATPase [Heliobacterium chlorum]
MKIRLNINSNTNPPNFPIPSWLPSAFPNPLIRGGNSESIERTILEKASTNIRAKQQNRLESVLEELDKMIGLKGVKELIYEIRAYVEVRNWREKETLLNDPMALHMIFKGNPGTGKTTVARLVGRLFKELNILPKGHLIEVERADLVGEYIGHTALKAREQVKKAIGGVLFVDEAYSLARGGEKDFGKEATDSLIKAMEDHRDNLILILSGYKDEMDYFLRSNPGIRSRFPIQLEFPDYTTAELLAIAEVMISSRQYILSSEAKLALRNFLLDQEKVGHQHRGNARMVRNIVEKAIRRQAVRIINVHERQKISRDALMILEAQDVMEGCQQVVDVRA